MDPDTGREGGGGVDTCGREIKVKQTEVLKWAAERKEC